MGCNVTLEGKVYYNGKELKQSNHSAGYKIVTIEGKMKYVHRLLAETFIPNPNNLPQVNHINGIKNDNRIENLEWIDIKGNRRHAIEKGLWGVNILKKRKLNDIQINQIKNKYIPRKYGYKQLAKEYNVDYRTIWDIINKKSYKNVVQL